MCNMIYHRHHAVSRDATKTAEVSGTRMHLSDLAFNLVFEHGVRHYQFELRAQSH